VTLDVTGALNVIDMGALAEAAVSGAGIAYLPHFMATDHIVDGDLKVLLPETIYEGQAIYMVYLRRRHASPRLQVFLDFLREVLSGSSAALQSLDAKQEKEKVV
jgi:LysR family transcriptional regulator, regulator for bpeEF and oprC